MADPPPRNIAFQNNAFQSNAFQTANLGVISATEARDTALFPGKVEWLGGITAAIEASDRAAYVGLVRWAVTIAAVEARDVANFSGYLQGLGKIEAVEAPDVADIQGRGDPIGNLIAQEARDTTYFSEPELPSGYFATTEGSDSAHFTEFIEGQLAAKEQPDTWALTGKVMMTIIGHIYSVEQPDEFTIGGYGHPIGKIEAVDANDIALFVGIAHYLTDSELVGRYELIDHAGAQVLYPAAAGLEKALADASTERMLRTPDWLITDQWEPFLISWQNLPYLAYGMGTTLWEDIWTEGIKREWVATQWTYRSLRGTPAGFRRALQPSGYDITDMVRPPQGFYLSPQLTKEEWDWWIHLMPELRITYAKREGVRGEDEFFLDAEQLIPGDFNRPQEVPAQVGFLDQDALCLNDGWQLYGRLAIIRQRGVDTPIHTIEFHPHFDERGVVDYERFSTIGRSAGGFIIDDSALGNGPRDISDTGYLCEQEVEPKLYTLRLDRSYNHDMSELALTTSIPDLDPQTVRYERESDVGYGDGFLFLDDVWFRPDLYDQQIMDREDGGGRLLADRIFLLDPSVAEPMTAGISFLNEMRLGLEKYLAEVQIDLHTFETAGVYSEFLDECFHEEAFLVPEDHSHQERAFRAINDAQAQRDTILVSFAPMRPLQMGDYMTSSTVYHQWVRAGL